MSAVVSIERAGPAMSVQDLGRPGLTAQGLSPGGAADRLALLEAAALLGLDTGVSAVEMAGAGGVFTSSTALRFALTGAPMAARLDGVALVWNASHVLHPGQRLSIGGAREGVYGYLSFAGAVAGPHVLDSPSAHITAGIGGVLSDAMELPLGQDPKPDAPMMQLPAPGRFSGGTLRLMPGPQSALFDVAVRERFFATNFRRGPQANRQGVQLLHDAAPFSSDATGGLASDFIVPGDVQMTGDGQPYVLLSECQTMGGYPRIGTVLPDDLPRLAQAPLNAPLRFVPVSLEEADGLYRSDAERLAEIRARCTPLIRDPGHMRDLLSYQLIGGVTCGDDLERI